MSTSISPKPCLDPDSIPVNPSARPRIGDVIAARLTRREALGALAATGAAALAAPSARGALASSSSLGFEELTRVLDDRLHVAPGYDSQVLLRWGDPVLPGAPPFDPGKQSAAAQEKQFGYNCDFVAFLPLPPGSQQSTRGLLAVNHEYTNAELLFPGLTQETILEKITPEQVEIEMAAHGLSVVEIEFVGGRWRVVADSPRNRRISARSTPMTLSGPAAGHPRLRTSSDPSARAVIGMLNNCAGGVTPWGTVLTCEENFNLYFAGDVLGLAEERNYLRYNMGAGLARYSWWGKFQPRFDVTREPNEANRFGWVVEIDPHDPAWVPVKRTALGRLKHEGAATTLAADGRVVVYSGDDTQFEYIYRFVTEGKFDPTKRSANRDLLDQGTLYVARFEEDGRLLWLPLVHGTGPLTAANDFHSQADVVIECRRAADLLGATPLDRPEDVDVNPVTGRVYAMLSNNAKRDQVAPATPRAPNLFGHILELIPPKSAGGIDHGATEYAWDVFIQAGNPAHPVEGAVYHPATSANGWFSGPDNCAFDRRGRIWIATDEAQKYARVANGLFAADTAGAGRALPRLFLVGPTGSEICGPCFTPDERTLFVAIQHPGEDPDSTFDQPSTRWPDFDDRVPPRPSVVAITKPDGGLIGDA